MLWVEFRNKHIYWQYKLFYTLKYALKIVKKKNSGKKRSCTNSKKCTY